MCHILHFFCWPALKTLSLQWNFGLQICPLLLMSEAFFSSHTVDKPWTWGGGGNYQCISLSASPLCSDCSLSPRLHLLSLLSRTQTLFQSVVLVDCTKSVCLAQCIVNHSFFLFSPLCFYNCLVFLLLLLVSLSSTFCLCSFSNLCAIHSTEWSLLSCSVRRCENVCRHVCVYFIGSILFHFIYVCSSSGSDFRGFRKPG